MIPNDYLRSDIWDMFHNEFPNIENIEEYNCPHQWWCDCGTVSKCEPLIYFCHWCMKRKEVSVGESPDD